MIRLEISSVNPHECVLVFPTFAQQHTVNGNWRFQISGAIYDRNDVTLKQRVLLRVLRRIMRIHPDALDSDIFRDRIEAFVSSPERGRRISVRVGNHHFKLSKKSKRNGLFAGSFSLSDDEVEDLREDGTIVEDTLPITVVTRGGEERQVNSLLYMIPNYGLSIVSDIDDTIKLTQVTNRRRMIENTFFREFESINGMSKLYQDWASGGAIFHYVSSSPWQLFRPLSGMIQDDEFPMGTIHLRDFRLRDQMLRRVMLVRRKGKAQVIKKLLESFPNRDFVFIGDSGEKDPEIYLKLARKFNGQVKGTFIRSLDEKPMANERFNKIRQKFPDGKFFQFSDAGELSELCQDIVSQQVAV